MPGSRIFAASAAALALAGCQGAHNGSGGGSNSICTPFPAANASATTANGAAAPATAAPLAAADPASALDDCLHRWAYALAPASDDATRVSQAALAACEASLGRWNQQTAS